MAFHNDLGKKAEQYAAEYIENLGYKILAKNYIWKKSEIDIIAFKDSLLVIVEVKARSSTDFIKPQEAVNKTKMKHIINATNAFIEKENILCEVRFDIIALVAKRNGEFEIDHLQDAFQAFEIN